MVGFGDFDSPGLEIGMDFLGKNLKIFFRKIASRYSGLVCNHKDKKASFLKFFTKLENPRHVFQILDPM
jgi:hypothetical protein